MKKKIQMKIKNYKESANTVNFPSKKGKESHVKIHCQVHFQTTHLHIKYWIVIGFQTS